jgi:hypothetical protein
MFAKKLISRLFSVLFVIIFILSVTPLQAARAAGVRYVKPLASGTGTCLSWANACALQTALTGAVSGEEIWVAAETYIPIQTTDRTATFQLKNGVAVYGGFAGTETARNQRSPATNVTTLSGEIGIPGNGDNSYHVVTGATGAILDGFTITAGNANGASDPNDSGGGMYNDSSSPTLTNVTFSGNSATGTVGAGGGMGNYDHSSPILTNVTFSSNTAKDFGGGMFNRDSSPTLINVTFSGNTTGYGGGMYNANNSNPILTNVTFSANTANIYGGGMYNYSSSPTLTNVTFSGNSATGSSGMGGGITNESSSPILTNVTFSGNSATTYGGGMTNEVSSPTLTNVTFSGNTATFGGGMVNYSSSPSLTNVTFSGNSAVSNGGGMDNVSSSNPQIRNTLFWGNTAPSGAQIYNNSGTPVVSNSVVQGGYTGGTNIITTNPLLGTLGNNGGFTQTIPLLENSSAIDTGNDTVCPAADQRGVARPQGAHCDIGAYEYEVNLVVMVGGAPQGYYNLTPGQSTRANYAVNNGPVSVASLSGTPIISSMRVAYNNGTAWTDFSEMMGLPANQATTAYWFPWYNNLDMNTQLRFANLGSTATNIWITIGGIVQAPIPLAVGQSTRVSYPINNGPVKVESSMGNIVASMRVAYNNGTAWTSYSEVLGLPANQATTVYWFPWYNNLDMNTQIRFANLGSTTNIIWVTIGGVLQPPTLLAAGQSTRVSYAINNGPVKVESSAGNIVASMRVAYKDGTAWTSYSEVLGLPANQATTTYWFPWYNNLGLNTQIRFANLGGTTNIIWVTIGGVLQPPILLAAGQSTRVSYAINNGPVKVESSAGNIVASMRVAYKDGTVWTNFSEVLGMPANQLTSTYWFPWYNNLDLNTQVRFAVP